MQWQQPVVPFPATSQNGSSIMSEPAMYNSGTTAYGPSPPARTVLHLPQLPAVAPSILPLSQPLITPVSAYGFPFHMPATPHVPIGAPAHQGGSYLVDHSAVENGFGALHRELALAQQLHVQVPESLLRRIEQLAAAPAGRVGERSMQLVGAPSRSSSTPASVRDHRLGHRDKPDSLGDLNSILAPEANERLSMRLQAFHKQQCKAIDSAVQRALESKVFGVLGRLEESLETLAESQQRLQQQQRRAHHLEQAENLERQELQEMAQKWEVEAANNEALFCERLALHASELQSGQCHVPKSSCEQILQMEEAKLSETLRREEDLAAELQELDRQWEDLEVADARVRRQRAALHLNSSPLSGDCIAQEPPYHFSPSTMFGAASHGAAEPPSGMNEYAKAQAAHSVRNATFHAADHNGDDVISRSDLFAAVARHPKEPQRAHGARLPASPWAAPAPTNAALWSGSGNSNGYPREAWLHEQRV